MVTNGTIWLFNIAMDNDPFIVDFPSKTSIDRGFSMAMLNNQLVIILRIVRPVETFPTAEAKGLGSDWSASALNSGCNIWGPK